MFTISIGQIISLGHKPPKFADPVLEFHDSECYLAPQFIPCIENSDSYLEVENTGDANEYCMLGVAIEGHTPQGEYMPIGDPFPMEAGETKGFQIIIHFSEEYWTETETITLHFYAGFCADPPPPCTQMYITDTVTLQTEIYVENGVAEACEDILLQADCIAANCHWYAKYIWEEPSCHEAEQNMIMDYLPFILAGAGGVIILAAVLSKSAPTYPPMPYYPPPPQYAYPTPKPTYPPY